MKKQFKALDLIEKQIDKNLKHPKTAGGGSRERTVLLSMQEVYKKEDMTVMFAVKVRLPDPRGGPNLLISGSIFWFLARYIRAMGQG